MNMIPKLCCQHFVCTKQYGDDDDDDADDDAAQNKLERSSST
jgi:hypothetical protein